MQALYVCSVPRTPEAGRQARPEFPLGSQCTAGQVLERIVRYLEVSFCMNCCRFFSVVTGPDEASWREAACEASFFLRGMRMTRVSAKLYHLLSMGKDPCMLPVSNINTYKGFQ